MTMTSLTPTADRVLSVARAERGYHEGRDPSGNWNNIQKYSPAVPGLEWSQGQAWCATFVSWVAMTAKVASLFPCTASTDTAASWYQSRKRWSEFPAIGAQGFLASNGDEFHTFLVDHYDDEYVYTTEGNTNDNGSSQGDGVYGLKRLRRSSEIEGYGYPDYPEGIVSADPAWASHAPIPAPVPPITPEPPVPNPLLVTVVKRTVLNGTIDGHDPLVVTFRIHGPNGWFRLTVVTVNWGRGYQPGEFRANVLNVLDHTDEKQYVVLLIQELDEADAAPERRIFMAEMQPGTTLVPQPPTPGRETIAVSPGLKVTHQRRTMTMDQGTKIGAPKGTGPRRFFVSCVTVIEGVTIGFGDQHPHRNQANHMVQEARRRGEQVTTVEVRRLVNLCDLSIYGGDMNDTHYPKSHPREQTAFERGLDTIRYVVG